MTKTNLVLMNEFKEQKELKAKQEGYKRYLGTLKNSQLETEINHLLEEFSNDTWGPEFFSKGKVILTEIASRADGDWKKSIENLSQEFHLS